VAVDMLDRFATETYGFGIEVVEQIQTFASGSPDAVAEQLRRFIDAGARHLVCRIGVLGPDPFLEQLDQLRIVKEALV
jgi:alkanesulfonate monooxygenase SsuD/methylene tetrahydromethanopterin reductase-like flavin-dependent oxidoreductase (luciferase family)